MSITVKIGDVIQARSGSYYHVEYGESTVIGLHGDWVWLKSGDQHYEVSLFVVESAWTKVPTFFQTSMVYRMPGGSGTWYIWDVYEVDKPMYGPERRIKAVAEFTDMDGKKNIALLTQVDFRDMELVK